ncbi:MAG: hypothetical protein AAGF79_16310 [Pseudomonadota bacterium]
MALIGFLNLVDLPGNKTAVRDTIDANDALLNDDAETMLLGLAGQASVDSFDFTTFTNVPTFREGPALTVNISQVDYNAQVQGESSVAFLEALGIAQSYGMALESDGLEDVYAIPIPTGTGDFEIVVVDVTPYAANAMASWSPGDGAFDLFG